MELQELIRVTKDGKIGYYEKNGTEVFSALAVVKRDGLYGKINREGAEVITAMFDEIE